MLSSVKLIVPRLRLAMSAILLLLFCTFIITCIQFFFLNKSQTQAIRESVPALAESQRLESLLAELLLLQSEISSASTINHTTEYFEKLEGLNGRIANSRNSMSSSTASRTLSTIIDELNRINLANFQLLEVRSDLIQNIEKLSVKREQLSSLSTQFLDFAEPELVDIETTLNRRLQQGHVVEKNDLHDTKTSDVGDEISRLVLAQNLLTEVTFRFLAANDEAKQLSRITSGPAPTEITSLISLNIRVSAQLLASLDDNDFRRNLADKISHLRQLIVGSDGITELLLTNAGLQQQVEDAQTENARKIIAISSKIDDVVSDARGQISDSSGVFARTLYLTGILLSVVGLLTLSIVLLVIYFVIEKQINRRISILTEAVLDIANGDTTRKVPITGDDEIGKMADSLLVFKDTAMQLRASNEELEQFAYAAAHDLRSPLIAIGNLAAWTLEDASDVLPENCNDNLAMIIKRVKRLSALQNDLLEYSRVGHVQNPVGEVNLEALVKDVEELIGSDGNYLITFSGHKTPVHTYVGPLRQIMINLINNSQKHHDKDTGIIEINAQLKGGSLEISVSDDGPGIALKFQNKVFDLFSTLNSQDEVEGSGLGLALVNKLVNKYHAKILVHSNPDEKRGTRFIIEWPVFDI